MAYLRVQSSLRPVFHHRSDFGVHTAGTNTAGNTSRRPSRSQHCGVSAVEHDNCPLDSLEATSSFAFLNAFFCQPVSKDEITPALRVHVSCQGFRRTKRTPSPRLSSTGGGGQGAAAEAAATTRGVTWEEFSHPLFRRGRRDLLAGIQRDTGGARLKPRKGATAGWWT